MFGRMDVREVPHRLADLPNLLDQLGSNQAELARHLKLDPSSMSKTIVGKRTLKADELIKIADFITDLEEKAGGGVADNARPFDARPRSIGQSIRPRGEAMIPVYGFPDASRAGRIDMRQGREIDYASPPAFWNGAGKLIGIRFPDEDLSPRYRTGERVFAVCGLPPQPDGDCVLEMQDGTAMVRTYIARGQGVIRVQYWRQTAEKAAELVHERIPEDQVRAVHAVLVRSGQG